MSIFNFLPNFAKAMNDCPLKDPGDAGTISVRQSGMLHLRSAGAETRTLPRPGGKGTILWIDMETDGGDITLTVTGGINEDGDTTFVFSDPGQFLLLVSTYQSAANTYQWRKYSDYALGNASPSELGALNGLTATAAELNKLDDDLATNILTAGAGISAAETYASGIFRNGNIIETRILVDLTGLVGSTTDLDIIGNTGGAASANFGQITVAKSGTIAGGLVTCLELPTGGADDIDFYSANESTGAQDALITSLTETILITSGAAWASGTQKGMTALPPANDYLYIVNGEGTVPGTFTAGKFLIQLFGKV